MILRPIRGPILTGPVARPGRVHAGLRCGVIPGIRPVGSPLDPGIMSQCLMPETTAGTRPQE
jgi:hypothetical protein